MPSIAMSIAPHISIMFSSSIFAASFYNNFTSVLVFFLDSVFKLHQHPNLSNVKNVCLSFEFSVG
jgi:hypothetical protein